MQPQDISIYEAFMRGDSIASLAKRYKLDKSQIKKVINRVGTERIITKPEVLHELHATTAHTGRDIQGV
jgi:Mor family transcriptional regulator